MAEENSGPTTRRVSIGPDGKVTGGFTVPQGAIPSAPLRPAPQRPAAEPPAPVIPVPAASNSQFQMTSAIAQHSGMIIGHGPSTGNRGTTQPMIASATDTKFTPAQVEAIKKTFGEVTLAPDGKSVLLPVEKAFGTNTFSKFTPEFAAAISGANAPAPSVDVTPRRVNVDNPSAYTPIRSEPAYNHARDGVNNDGSLNTAGKIFKLASRTDVAGLTGPQAVYSKMEELAGKQNPPISKEEFAKAMSETRGLAEAVGKDLAAVRKNQGLPPASVDGFGLENLARHVVNAIPNPAHEAAAVVHAADLAGKNDFKIKGEPLQTRDGLVIGNGPASQGRSNSTYVITTENGQPFTKDQISALQEKYGDRIKISDQGNAVQFEEHSSKRNEVLGKFQEISGVNPQKVAELDADTPRTPPNLSGVEVRTAPPFETFDEVPVARPAFNATAFGVISNEEFFVTPVAAVLDTPRTPPNLSGVEVRTEPSFATLVAEATVPPATLTVAQQAQLDANMVIAGSSGQQPTVAPAAQTAPSIADTVGRFDPAIYAAAQASVTSAPPAQQAQADLGAFNTAGASAPTVAQAAQPTVYTKEDVPTLSSGVTTVIQTALKLAGEQCGKHGPKGDGVDGKCGPDTKTMIAKMCTEAGVNPQLLAGPETAESRAAMEKLSAHIGGKIMEKQHAQDIAKAQPMEAAREARTAEIIGEMSAPSTPKVAKAGGTGRG